MAGGTEIELKLLVDGPAALRAVAAAAAKRGARASAPRRQENHFFDTADGRLRRADQTLRLRAEEGRFELAAKGAAAEQGDPVLHVRAEDEAEVDAELARRVLAGEVGILDALERALGRTSPLLARMRAALAGAALAHAGSFENQRVVVGPLLAGGERLALELDRTRFPGGREDCEVELELPASAVPAGRALLLELLAEAGVEGRPAPSKAARFFEALSAARSAPR